MAGISSSTFSASANRASGSGYRSSFFSQLRVFRDGYVYPATWSLGHRWMKKEAWIERVFLPGFWSLALCTLKILMPMPRGPGSLSGCSRKIGLLALRGGYGIGAGVREETLGEMGREAGGG